MACNTTSALTYEVLKDNYDFKIYPVVQNVAELISQQMEQVASLSVPLLAEAKWGKSWYEAK